MNQVLYNKIAVTVATAMEHKGTNSRHNGAVVEKVTRDILTAFREELPPFVDIDGKWEETGRTGVHVKITGNFRSDKAQIDYLGSFAVDQGYNTALVKIYTDLTVPLKKVKRAGIVK